MCRMIGFSVRKPLSRAKIQKVTAKCRDLLEDQSDGFGYALSGGDIKGITHLRLTSGNLLGYRTSNLGEWQKAGEPAFDSHGVIKPCTAGIYHGRISTNDLGVENTHPFVNESLALAHNGIVDYHGPERPKKGTCDSEDLFNAFTLGKGFSEFGKYFEGYAALLLLYPSGFMTFYRDETPTLYVARFKSGYVVATSIKDATSLVTDVFKEKPEVPFLAKAEHAIETVNGEIKSVTHVGAMPSKSFAKDSLSLGRSKSSGKKDKDYDLGYDDGYYDAKNKKSYRYPSKKSQSYIDGFNAGFDAGETAIDGEDSEFDVDDDNPVKLQYF